MRSSGVAAVQELQNGYRGSRLVGDGEKAYLLHSCSRGGSPSPPELLLPCSELSLLMPQAL
jgi:hypothetical protein